MGATTSFDTVVWLFIGVFALICAVWLARAVWRLVVGATARLFVQYAKEFTI